VHRFRFKGVVVVAVVAVLSLTAGTAAVGAEEPTTTTIETPSTTTTESPPTTQEVVDTTDGSTDATVPVTVASVSVTDPTSGDVTTTTDELAPAGTTDSTDTTVEGATDSDTTVAVTTTTTQPHHSANEQTVVTATQVAVGNSGGNHTQTDGTGSDPGTAVVPSAHVDTGSAAAIGSRDTNTIGQQADLVLTDQAVARVLQVALVINIGMALANTGANDVLAALQGTSNPGAITTGNAVAVGNETDQYLTQGARTSADSNMDDYANQLAISLWMGLAQSNSGLNAVTGTGVSGSGGAVTAGDATAIGNDSITGIDQRAAVLGSGTSQTDVTQRATVLNLGFALANSGLNNVSGMASGLLSASDADDDVMAENLFAMLLPALLQSYGYGPTAGSGTIGSGNASAIGNQSETYVKQMAMAASSGDGINQIVQEVLVANMGVAGANTGGNGLGADRASLDPQTAIAVVKMAAFLASMLAVVHQATGSTTLALQNAGIEIPFGDIVFQVSGALSSFDTDMATDGGAQAHIRQISIVLSLGVAKANTGANNTTTVQTAGLPASTTDVPALATPAVDSQVSATRQAEVNTELAAVGAAATNTAIDTIDTGNVATGNRGIVIICQRINAEDVSCLAPPADPPVTPPTPPVEVLPDSPQIGEPCFLYNQRHVMETSTCDPVVPLAVAQVTEAVAPVAKAAAVSVSHATLPATGTNSQPIIVTGIALLLLGAFLTFAARRKRSAVQDA
jgi:LPXTG-motif cell wall-anchored protein